MKGINKCITYNELCAYKMSDLRNILKSMYYFEPVKTKKNAIEIIITLQSVEAKPYFR